MTKEVKVVTIEKSQFSCPYSWPYRYTFTISNRKIVNREGKMFLWPFSKSFCLTPPTIYNTFWRAGRRGSQQVENLLEIVNLRFTIFTIYDFFDCHYL